MKKQKKSIIAKVNEPGESYKKTLPFGDNIVVTNHKNLEEADRNYMGQLTYIERFAYLQKLISITHGTDLSKQEKAFYYGRISIRTLE